MYGRNLYKVNSMYVRAHLISPFATCWVPSVYTLAPPARRSILEPRKWTEERCLKEGQTIAEMMIVPHWRNFLEKATTDNVT